MIDFFTKLFDSNEKQILRINKIVAKINQIEGDLSTKSIEDMKLRLDSFREKLRPLVDEIPIESKDSLRAPDRKKPTASEKKVNAYLQEILPEVYAIVRETAKRVYNRRHFDVQLIGGIILSEGKIAELKTGEGKTQVAWLPLALYGLTGRGAHLVTVNDYLAKSHGEYSGFIFSLLGYTVGVTEPHASYVFITDEQLEEFKGEEILQQRKQLTVQNPGDTKGFNLRQVSKSESYNCDILYATNNEVGFDYLKDNMANKIEDMVQRELYFAIVDEVDSILIDEARTPLIISMPKNNSNELYIKFAKIVENLSSEDYLIDDKGKSVSVTEAGTDKIEQMLSVKNIWEDYHYAHHLDNALKAKFLFKNNDEYIVQNGEILIVDEFTGRVLPGRRFGEGIHQAIEAKEKVRINQESSTMATITFQNLFRLYKNLSGMTGTAVTESEEFYKIYNLEVISVPTNRKISRIDLSDLVYKNQEAKFTAVANEIEKINSIGQPVLVGTTSVAKSEYLSEMLRLKGIKHEVLNAKYHEREALIISNAGQLNAVTIATNMAGRGTDIKLGTGAEELGGLYVIGTERHESRRIDNQLRGRSGRQGDKGISRFYLSLDDEIMRIQGGMFVQKIMTMANLDPSLPIESSVIGRTIETAQKRVEGNNFDQRKIVVEYDDVINKQREIFYSRRKNLLRNISKARLDLSANTLEIDDTIKIARDNIQDQIYKGFEEYLKKQINFKNSEEEIITEFLKIYEETIFVKSAISLDLSSRYDAAKQDLINKIESFNNQSEIFQYLFDFTKKTYQLLSEENGQVKLFQTYFNLLLQVMDELWMEHLETMSDIRSGIFLNSYAQKDPLIEYKNIGFDRFDIMIGQINHYLVSRLFKVKKVELTKLEVEQLLTNIADIDKVLEKGAFDLLTENMEPNQESASDDTEFKSSKPSINYSKVEKVGRNELCPCGSGKKYKNCHGKES
jgi:preprotein translocase subunit SecA